MIILRLLVSFAQIGLLGFGGGYAMIPLIQEEITVNNWLTASEFADIVAVSQMTPGPIAVNAATFIGIRAAGIPGALAATFGLLLPSLIILILAARMIDSFKESRFLQAILTGIRPAAIGLIASAVMFFASMSVFRGDPREGDLSIDLRGAGIFLLILLLSKRFKVHPITCVLLSAASGILVYTVIPQIIG